MHYALLICFQIRRKIFRAYIHQQISHKTANTTAASILTAYTLPKVAKMPAPK